MRFFTAPELAYLDQRRGWKARVLVWAVVKDPVTGAPEAAGLWNGHIDRMFSINGESRLYRAAGRLLQVPTIVYQIGGEPRVHRIQLTPLDANVAALFRGYDTRLAPIEIHRAMFDLDTGALIAEPRRLVKGFIDKAPIQTPAVGGQTTIEVSIVTNQIDMQRTGTQMKSDAQQRLRSGDRFRRYNAISGEVQVKWGAGKAWIPPKPKKPKRLKRRGGGRKDD